MLASVAMALTAGTAQAETIKVGVEETDYLPHYGWQDGVYSGFGAAVLDAWAADAGHQVEYRAMPVKRLMRALVRGDIDLKYPANAAWSTDVKQGQQVNYSDPVVAFVDGTHVPQQHLGRSIDAIEQLGIISGFTPQPWLDLVRDDAVELAENSSFQGLIRQGLRQRVDAVYLNTAVLEHVLAEQLNQPDALVFDPDLPYARDHYHVASTTRPALLDSLNAWLAGHQDRLATLKRDHGLTD